MINNLEYSDRIDAILKLITEFASSHLSDRESQADGNQTLDAIQEGINLLAQEIQRAGVVDPQFWDDEMRLQQFFDAVPVGVYVMNSEFIGVFANEFAIELLGTGIVPNAKVEDLPEIYQTKKAVTGELYPASEYPLVMALTTGATIYKDDMEIHREDRVIPIEVWARPIRNSKGEIIYAVATFNDIARHKRKEDVLIAAKDEAVTTAHIKQQFLANMSHEIRTPMNAILGFSNLLKKTELNTQQNHFIESISYSAENLLVIINDILDFSKLETGNLEIAEHIFNLPKLLRSLMDSFGPMADKKALTLRKSTSDGLPEYVSGDVTRINQVLTNLLSNGLKFTSEGEVVLNVTLLSFENGTNKIRFSVKDTGIGIAKDRQPHIFESFTQANRFISSKFGGTGLGLTISRNLVQLMGGEIDLVSEPGKGSEFSFELSLKTAKREETKKSTVRTVKTFTKDISTLKILLVEDNELNIMVATNTLKNVGLATEVARNGQIAVEMARDNDYDLVLMDIQMPVMDGITATREIRKLPGKRGKIPIMAMSAHVMSQERENCEEAGMNDYVTKPFKPEELFEKISRLILYSED